LEVLHEFSYEADRPRAAAFAPLMECHAMTHLHLFEAGLRIFWDDANILKMAQSWPELRSLQLCTSMTYPCEANISLYSLLPLAIHCPHLQYLAIPVDVDHVIVPENLPPPNYDMRTFEMRCPSIVEQVDKVAAARLIKGIWPNVSLIVDKQSDARRPTVGYIRHFALLAAFCKFFNEFEG